MEEPRPKQKLTIEISMGTLFKVAIFVLCIYAAITLRGLILVLISAVVIASVIEPGTRWLTRRGIQRVFAASIMYIGIAAVAAATFSFVVPPLFSETASALNSLPKYVKTIDIFNPLTGNAYKSVKTFFPDIPNTISIGDLAGYTAGALSQFSGGLFDTVTGFFGGVVSIVLVVVISFYLSVRDDGVGEFLSIITPLRYEKYVKGLWQRSQNKIGKWMQGQLLLGLFVGVLTYVALLIAGIPHALLLAFLAAIFELVPIVGMSISAIPAFILATLDGGFGLGLIVIAIYVVIQQIESHIMYPLVAKKVIGIPPLMVIIALVAGAELAGLVGALLAVPLSVVLMELIEDVEKNKRFSTTENIT
ncbi:MAG: AI-2E family transporter [Candidatus Taylorbacteria bacterium]|nr:AI-2E family transporter [Candidatus Taylorbacteria bacterium]